MSLLWQVADEPDVVHRLVVSSDHRAAAITGTVAPHRRRQTTLRLVTAGVVHLGLIDGRPVVTVAVGPEPTFDADRGGLPAAVVPWYMQRLAVDLGSPDPLAGFHAVRHAIDVATAGGADVLRAEANPDLVAVLRMLSLVGFQRHRTDETAELSRTFLQRAL